MRPCLPYDDTDYGCDTAAEGADITPPHPIWRATASTTLAGNRSGVSPKTAQALPTDLPRIADAARAPLFTLRRLVAGTLATVATSSILIFIDFLMRYR
jgi:hypothetical protein